ncbi:MAG TPA: ISNCY family transposase [Thermoanaerobaculia bacterium]|nr:ISNCY family transposase [Thermoanaerobaculia bacterium]
MREAHKTQPSLRETWLNLDHAKELAAMSRVLDDRPTVAEQVWQDLRGATRSAQATRGAGGLSADQVLRILVVKQMNGFSYRELAFHLADSRSYRTFCRLGITDKAPTKSALNANLKSLQPTTLEAINRVFVGAAQAAKVETGRTVRTDCTVVESNIHQPMDSDLLWDCVRVLSRLLGRARDVLGPAQVIFGNRTRRAKRRRKEIFNATRAEDRQRAYRDLLAVTAEVYRCGLAARELLRNSQVLNNLGFWEALVASGVAAELARFLPLTLRVMDQTQRRVLDGQSVPAGEKLVSIFEEHTDIIRKDKREILYGHKICLTGGASSMILDCKVLQGNPADATLAKTMVDRQVEIFSRPPRQIVFDGGFASKVNLTDLKAAGVQDVAFSKGRGLEVSDMVKSSWVFKRLRDFRAGIEGNISFLKRIFGLDRCTWKSWSSFQSYVWGSILSFNLLVFARHLLS